MKRLHQAKSMQQVARRAPAVAVPDAAAVVAAAAAAAAVLNMAHFLAVNVKVAIFRYLTLPFHLMIHQEVVVLLFSKCH